MQDPQKMGKPICRPKNNSAISPTGCRSMVQGPELHEVMVHRLDVVSRSGLECPLMYTAGSLKLQNDGQCQLLGLSIFS